MKYLFKSKSFKRLLCVTLSIMIVIGFVPLQANAYAEQYSYRIVNLNQNTTVAAITDIYNYNEETDVETTVFNLYKITVPANGYVKFQVSNSSNYLRIYRTIDKSKDLNDASNSICDLDGARTYYKVLPKGSYYLSVSGNMNLKWSFTKVKNKLNYCRAKATTLKRGKKVITVFNYGYEYDKWYKIKITKKKKITVSLTQKELNAYGIEFALYNSRGIMVRCPSLTEYKYQTAKLPKGTYFIRVKRDIDYDEYDRYDGRICQISWK